MSNNNSPPPSPKSKQPLYSLSSPWTYPNNALGELILGGILKATVTPFSKLTLAMVSE